MGPDPTFASSASGDEEDVGTDGDSLSHGGDGIFKAQEAIDADSASLNNLSDDGLHVAVADMNEPSLPTESLDVSVDGLFRDAIDSGHLSGVFREESFDLHEPVDDMAKEDDDQVIQHPPGDGLYKLKDKGSKASRSPKHPNVQVNVSATAEVNLPSPDGVYKAEGKEALQYIQSEMRKNKAMDYKSDFLDGPPRPSRISRSISTDSSTAAPNESKRYHRSTSSCSSTAPLRGYRRSTSSCSSSTVGRNNKSGRSRSFRSSFKRRSQATSSTAGVLTSFAITTVKPAPPPVYQQYIHDRVHGHSFVPRFEREALKANKNRRPKKNGKDEKKPERESMSSSSAGLGIDESEIEDPEKLFDFVSDAFMFNGDNVSGVFRSIQSYADSDRPDNLEEEEDPIDCKNRPPHFLCYLPPCVARWPGVLEQNRFCEAVGRIGLHDVFKNQRIARRRIFAVGFTFNLLALILMVAASMAFSRDYRILNHTSFAQGVASIPNHPPFLVKTGETKVATLYMGFRALTSNDGILVNPNSVLFTTFCRGHGLTSVSRSGGGDSGEEPMTQEDAFKEALAPEICGSCSQSSQGFVISIVFNFIFIIKNMFSDITRMYPKYDLNCPNFAGSLMATLSVFLGLYTILAYRSRCFTSLTKDLSDFGIITSDGGNTTLSFANSTLFLIPDHLRQNWEGYESEMNVNLEWEAGPGLWCMWIATGLKIVDAICNFIVPTPSITRDYQRREDYEYEFGDPGKFIDIEDDEDDLEDIDLEQPGDDETAKKRSKLENSEIVFAEFVGTRPEDSSAKWKNQDNDSPKWVYEGEPPDPVLVAHMREQMNRHVHDEPLDRKIGDKANNTRPYFVQMPSDLSDEPQDKVDTSRQESSYQRQPPSFLQLDSDLSDEPRDRRRGRTLQPVEEASSEFSELRHRDSDLSDIPEDQMRRTLAAQHFPENQFDHPFPTVDTDAVSLTSEDGHDLELDSNHEPVVNHALSHQSHPRERDHHDREDFHGREESGEVDDNDSSDDATSTDPQLSRPQMKRSNTTLSLT